MPKEDNEMLKYNDSEKAMKVSFIIYKDLESLLEKISTYHNKPEKLSATKINIYLLVIHCLHTVHLIKQKICLFIIEAKIV